MESSELHTISFKDVKHQEIITETKNQEQESTLKKKKFYRRARTTGPTPRHRTSIE